MKGSKKRSTKKSPKQSKKQEAPKSKSNTKFILFVAIILVIAGFLALAYYQEFWPFKKKDNQISEKKSLNIYNSPSSSPGPINKNKSASEKPDNFKIKKISDTYKIPIEIFNGEASRALPMTADARKIIHDKYLPDMVGVPKTGEPFRLTLERDIDESLLKEILLASIKDMYTYEDVIFIKTVQPDVVFGVVTKITGDMVNYCNPNLEECTPIEVFMYNGFIKQQT